MRVKLTTLLAILIPATILWIFVMSSSVKPLTTKDIIGFEMAKTIGVSDSLKSLWNENGLMELFRLHIYLDFVYILLYGASLYSLVAAVTRGLGTIHASTIGYWCSIAALIACACDVFENIGMLWTINMRSDETIVLITYWLAATKFALISIVVAFVIIGGIFWLLRRRPSLH